LDLALNGLKNHHCCTQNLDYHDRNITINPVGKIAEKTVLLTYLLLACRPGLYVPSIQARQGRTTFNV